MKKIISTLFVAGSLGFAASAQALMIDSFEVVQVGAIAGPAPLTLPVASVAGPGIIGGARDLTIDYTAGPGDILDTTTAGANGSEFVVANGVVSNSEIILGWDALGADLTDGGLATGLFLAFPVAIDNDLTIDFTFNGFASSSTTFPNGSSGSDFFIPFSSFSDGGAAASAVGSLEMVLSSTAGWDAAIDFIETRPKPPAEVPTPGILILMAAGLLGFASMRKK